MTLFSDCQKLRQTNSHLRCSKLASSLDLWGLLAGLMLLSQPSCGWRLVLGQNSKSNQRGSESYYPPLLPLPKYIKKIITNRSFLPACAFLGASPASTGFAQTGELLLAFSLLRLKTSRWYFFHFKTFWYSDFCRVWTDLGFIWKRPGGFEYKSVQNKENSQRNLQKALINVSMILEKICIVFFNRERIYKKSS